MRQQVPFSETLEVEILSKRFISAAVSMGMPKHKVGLWSPRKDACEKAAAAGDGEVAARVLGHRHVNSRTMDRVYRADLRTRDLGAYATGRAALASVAAAPLTSLSARRVPEMAGVVFEEDVPLNAPERRQLADEYKEGLQATKSKVDASLEAWHEADAALVEYRSRRCRPEMEVLVGAEAAAQEALKKALVGVEAAAQEAYKKAVVKRQALLFKVRAELLDRVARRLYVEGLERLRAEPEEKMRMIATHKWEARTEDEAITFGLDRCDRTLELAALRKLPAQLRGAVLAVGALHILPAGGSKKEVYAKVRMECEAGLCQLYCKDGNCSTSHAPMLWPETHREFETMACKVCSGQVALQWTGERGGVREVDCAAGVPFVLGALTIYEAPERTNMDIFIYPYIPDKYCWPAFNLPSNPPDPAQLH